MRFAWAFVATFSGLAACFPAPQFNCSGSNQCVAAGETGICQPTGFCSFPDERCPSKQRYGTYGGALGGSCVPPGSTGTDSDDGSGGTDGGTETVTATGPELTDGLTTMPGTTATTGTSSTSVGTAAETSGGSPICGDGAVQAGEACDDGNADDTDACVEGCRAAACGDGFVYAGVEECDDTNSDESDGCREDCTAGWIRTVIQLGMPDSNQTGSMWKYHDQGIDLGTSWRSAGFDDASWSSGVSSLGFGNDGEQTVLPNASNASPNYPSVYFRNTIELDGTVVRATMRLVIDDGVAVWINGTRISQVDVNVGNGVGYGSWASGFGNHVDYTETLNLSPSPFQVGTNVIAVMLKNSDSGSSDISVNMNLELEVDTQ